MAAPRLVFSERARLDGLPGGVSDAPSMRPWLPWLGVAYGVLGLLGVGGCWAFGRNAFTTEAWLGTSGVEAVVSSVLLGAASAGLVIIFSRRLASHTRWARALHDKLRPFVRGEGTIVLFTMAAGSGLCEELFFRAFLGRTIGIVLAAIAFGALHQVRGRGRWGWMLSAAALSAWLSVLFAMTGQLIGPIIAHVMINAVNLRHLRDHDVAPKSRKLGGLLAGTTPSA